MNETTRSQFSELVRFSEPMMKVAGAFTIIIMIVGVLGNLLTVVALVRHSKLRTVAAAFIASLCVSDLLFCLVVLPFAASQFFHGTWIHGDVLCVVIPVLRYGSVGVSLLCIAMISVNRYVLIAYPHLYARLYTRRNVAAAIASIWCFSYCVQLPTILGAWGTYGLDSRLGTCSINKDGHGNSPKAFLFALGFALPCVVIVVSYATIYWTVRSSHRRLQQHSSSGVNCKKSEMHVTKMVLVIFVCFVVCYLPITIVKVLDEEVRHAPLHVLGYLLIYLSSCVNPVVYVTMNKQYRQAYLDTLRCTLRSSLDSQNTPQQHSKTPNMSVTYLKNNMVNHSPKAPKV